MEVMHGVAQSSHDIAESYRKLAWQCREMAKRERRPGPLLIRAAALDATADYVERKEPQADWLDGRLGSDSRA